MDYEAIDRHMSSWVIATERVGILFFLTDDGLATDIPARASVFRWADQAGPVAAMARQEYAWEGWDWRPMRVAAVVARRNTK